MEPPEEHRRVWQIGIILCFVTFILYIGVLKAQFVNFDDEGYVTKNTYIQDGITFSALSWAATAGYASNWHPLTWVSHMVDWQIFGLKHPGGHHLTNLLFHVANTLLLFLVLRKMTGRLWPSAMVAALFGWHPLHVESVAWVSERKDVLSTLFWLLAMHSYVDYVKLTKEGDTESRIYYRLTLLWFALGLMSKPMLVTLPFVLLLLDFWPLKRSVDFGARSAESKTPNDMGIAWTKLAEEKLPFFVLAFVSSLVTFLVQRQSGAVIGIEKAPLGLRFANAMVEYVVYLRKTFWPSDLAVFYPMPHSIPASQWLLAGVLLISISAAAIMLARTRPHLAFGWFWFLGTLVPVIGLVQVGSQALADRYTYMPLVGIFIAVVWGVADFFGKLNLKNAAWAIAVPALAACFPLTWRQVGFWQNSELLFRHAIDVTPHNLVAHLDLGRALDESNRPDDAQAEFAAALKLEPKSPGALTSMGVHYARVGDVTNAVHYYESALAIEPLFTDAHYNLGNVLARERKYPEAAGHFTEALRLKPDSPDAENNLGATLVAMGKLDDAVAHFENALRLNPNFPEAQIQLGTVLQKKGDLGLAQMHFEDAVRLKPDFVPAQLKLGLVMARRGNVQGAVPHFQTALAIEPANADGHYYLGAAYEALGNWNLAATEFAETVRLKPNDADARKRLASMQAKLNKKSEKPTGPAPATNQISPVPAPEKPVGSTNLQAPTN